MNCLRYFFIVTFVLFYQLGNSQTTKYVLDNLGSIEISNSLELQNTSYAAAKNKMLAEYNLPTKAKTVFQQTGLNNGNPEAQSTYARLILEIEYGDFVNPTYNPADDPEFDLPYMCDAIHENLERSFSSSPLKFESFGSCKIPRINGNYAVYYSYTRSYPPNPSVLVETYIFQNLTKKITVTSSYRIEDRDKWKSALENAVNSFILD